MSGIEAQYIKVEKIAEESKKTMDLVLRGYSEHFVTAVEDQMALSDYLLNYSDATGDHYLKKRLLSRRESLMILRARTGYKFPWIDQQMRQRFLLELSACGTKEDIQPLQELLDSRIEEEQIKKIAYRVIESINSRIDVP